MKKQSPAQETTDAGAKPAGIAVIRIRGIISIRPELAKNLELMNLMKKNYCTVIEDTPSNRGMAIKAKDYATYGEIDQETFNLLIEKRGEEWIGKEKSSTLIIGGKKYKPFFRLCPPRGGFERKGIKQPFTTGGALGNRGAKINQLIRKMI